MRLGTLLFILLVVLVLAVLLGAGSYSVNRYWSPAGSEVVDTDTGMGAGAGVAAAIVALLVLILLFFGFTQWNWFGTRSAAPAITNNPSVVTPAPGGSPPPTSPSAAPSPSK